MKALKVEREGNLPERGGKNLCADGSEGPCRMEIERRAELWPDSAVPSGL